MIDTKLMALDAKIERLRDRMGRVGAISVGAVDDFRDKFDFSWIYHDNALEGVVLSYSELKAAIDTKIISDVTLIPMYEEIKHQKTAIGWIREQAKKKKAPITLDTIKKLYETLTPEAAAKVMQYRKDNPLHRVYYHEIAPPEKIAMRMKKLVEWLASDESETLHPVRFAARAHYRLLATYPWTKNSGKVARLLMNYILLREGYPPVVIHAIERQRYYEVMRNEHAGIESLVLESLENGVETATKFFDEVLEARRQRAAS
jgi:Fic family protein